MQIMKLQSVNINPQAQNKDFKPNFCSLNVGRALKSDAFENKFLQSFSDTTGIIRKRIEHALLELAKSFKSDKLPEVTLKSIEIIEIPEDKIIKAEVSYPKPFAKLAKQLGCGDTATTIGEFFGIDNLHYHTADAVERGYKASQKIGKSLSRINALLKNNRLVRKAVYSNDSLNTFTFLKEKNTNNLEIFERFLRGASDANERIGSEQAGKLISLSVQNTENPYIAGQHFKQSYNVHAKFLVNKKIDGKDHSILIHTHIKEPMVAYSGLSPAIIGAIQENTKKTILAGHRLAKFIQKNDKYVPENIKFQNDGFIVDVVCNS